MKRIFTLLASVVLVTSLLPIPCFAAEPEDFPTPQSGVIEPERPDDNQQPESLDESGIQSYDAFPGSGEAL